MDSYTDTPMNCALLLLPRLLLFIAAAIALLCLGACGGNQVPQDVMAANTEISDLTRLLCIRPSDAYYDRYTGEEVMLADLYPICWSNGVVRFPEGLVPARRKNSLVTKANPYGFVDTTGRVVIPFRFDDAEYFQEGRAAVRLNDQWGLIDMHGNWIVAPGIYHYVGSLREGRSAFRAGEKWGFLDRDGNVVVPAIYNQVLGYRDGLCLVQQEPLGRYVCIDLGGRVLFKLPDECKAVWWGSGGGGFSNGLALVIRSFPDDGPRYGFIGTDGNLAIDPVYKQAADSPKVSRQSA
jgi:hypothetical protein